MNSAVILAARYPERVDRLVAVAPYVPLEPKTSGTFWTIDEIREEADLFSAHGWRTEWPAFARWFMSRVFSEPDSEATIRELVAIALEASPEILLTQERELNWDAIPPLLRSVTNPTLLIHGDGDLTTPIPWSRHWPMPCLVAASRSSPVAVTARTSGHRSASTGSSPRFSSAQPLMKLPPERCNHGSLREMSNETRR